jgi:hypothetical protein
VLGGSEEGGNTVESLVATKNERKSLLPICLFLEIIGKIVDFVAENLPPNEEKNYV